MFGSTKRKVDIPLGSKGDSHWHDQMNFSYSKVANVMTPINESSIVDVGDISDLNPIITQNGAKVFECLCGDDIWQIEQCPPKSSSHF